jgi:choline dehydrogenase-like flavoprotein
VLIDARTIPNNHALETDICIIGAGAAGITLALQFMGRPFRVCLLESGGLHRDEDTQELSRGENLGLPYFPLHIPRLRYFGGTTNHWGGMCAPFDDIDFEARDWIPYSGWPFVKSAIDPF